MEGLELAGAPVDTSNVYARIASSIVFYDTNTGNVIREYFYGLSEVSIFDVSVDDADLVYYSVPQISPPRGGTINLTSHSVVVKMEKLLIICLCYNIIIIRVLAIREGVCRFIYFLT